MVNEETVFLFAVLSQGFAMIAGKYDQHAVVKTLPLKVRHDPRQLTVGICNFPVVRCVCKTSTEGLGRVVSAVGIVQVQPEEKWFTAGGAQPFQSLVNTRASLPFHQPGIVLKEAAASENVIVEIEPSVQAPTAIQHVGTDDGCSIVPVGLQRLRHGTNI